MSSFSSSEIQIDIEMPEISALDYEPDSDHKSEYEFVHNDVYMWAQINSKKQIPDETDFYFDTILCGGGKLRWMAVNHPIALLLRANEVAPRGHVAVSEGNLYVHEEHNAQACVKKFVELCEKYNLEIKKSYD